MIELMGPKEVTIHLEFIHPSYEQHTMFINDKKDRMIEIVSGNKLIMYKRTQVPDKPEN